MTDSAGFKLTYGTMFDPPEELHSRFSQATESVKTQLGKEYGMLIDGKDHFTAEKFEDRNPADTRVVLGIFQKGDAQDAHAALTAAKKAFPSWSRTPWQKRVELLRKAADLICQRQFEMSVVKAMEVGKNRMESLGDVVETAELIRYACDRMEENNGFVIQMGRDPLRNLESTNVSVLRPYGVWVIISPFNYPAALTGGPAGAALVAGNTVVFKPSSETPWIPRILAECLRDAGIPDGVFNYVTGPGNTIGQALIESPDVDGLTFTGSYDVGMRIYKTFANGLYIRPLILEMGGKNAAIVTKNAVIEDAVIGIMRSCFGLQGQKCSACSRVFIEKPVYDTLVERLVAMTEKLVIGDPVERETYMGPVINEKAYRDYQNYCEELNQHGRLLTGGKILSSEQHAHGYFVRPTIVADLPLQHPLWQTEMFLPIVTLAKIDSLQEGLSLANSVKYGLTAGFYGSPEETEIFFDQIEAGVGYANRPLGATTGAWPGYQPFGGWKASGGSGKNAGGYHYLQLYMHEQIQNRVRRL
ncbi:MAG: aldehyde dehydrogenase family protein [Anaerolineae bacterium]|nr:aldehyde dehydrogenase family protein [Anaerolineae bacterium]